MDIKIELTKTKKTKPGYNNLGFGQNFTDHMFIMDYTEGKGWHDARVIPYAPLALDPAAMVLHYGQAVFEGLKAYKNVNDEVVLFRPLDNFKRLNVSDERLCIPHIDEQMALEGLKKLIQTDIDWMPQEDGKSMYIRPFTIATEPALGVRPSKTYNFIIIMCPVGSYYSQGINPIDIFIEDEYVRSVKGGLGFTKASANYAASLKGQMKAKEKGYTQVLWLDGVHRKFIEEVGTTNVFFKIDGKLITPELSGSILPGITRDSVMKVARSWGIEVVERKISVLELYEAHEKLILEEAFATGTAAVISPIGSFLWEGKKITVANGEIGNLSQKLYDTITGIQYGKVKDEFDWIEKV